MNPHSVVYGDEWPRREFDSETETRGGDWVEPRRAVSFQVLWRVLLEYRVHELRGNGNLEQLEADEKRNRGGVG